MTITNIKTKVPAAFSETRSSMRSDSYDFISTEDIMGTFQKNNWFPQKVSQINNYSKKMWNKNHAKHLITFRDPDLPLVNDLYPEINLINSHDGSSKFKMFAGLFRMVCANGLIVSESPAVCSGTLTTNQAAAACVNFNRLVLKSYLLLIICF